MGSRSACVSELRHLGSTTVLDCGRLLDLIAGRFTALRSLVFVIADCQVTALPANLLGIRPSLRSPELVYPELDLGTILQTLHALLIVLAIGRQSLKRLAAEPDLLEPASGLGTCFRAVCESQRIKPKRHPALHSVGLVDAIGVVNFRSARFASSPDLKRITDELVAVDLELVDPAGRTLSSTDCCSDEEETSSSNDDDEGDDEDDEDADDSS